MIQIDTQYTFELYQHYVWFNTFRGKYYRFMRAAFVIVTPMVTATGIASFSMNAPFYLSLFLCAVGALGLLLLYFLFTQPRKYFAQASAAMGEGATFLFHDHGIENRQRGTKSSGHNLLSYEAVYRAYETFYAFFIYVAPNQAYLISKSHFVEGTAEELTTLLEQKLGKKFKICD